jgi:hypothetical protein
MRLVGIPADEVDDMWTSVNKMIEAAIDYGTARITSLDVYKKIKAREYQLWTVQQGAKVKAAVVTEIVDAPRGRVASIFICTGEDMGTWVQFLGQIEQWAKENHCDTIEALARPGWKRMLPEYRARHIHLERKL